MLKVERHDIISKELEKQGFVLVPSLSALLNCSEETIRRDLNEMEKAGKLLRTHGGAYQAENYDKGYPTELRMTILQGAKEHLAELVKSEIHENDMIMLDSSTTCLAIAETIIDSKLTITLITNSLEIFNKVNSSNTGINLICVGGSFRKRTTSFADPTTVEALKGYHADKAFISCPKVTMEHGLSDNHISEANVRKQMILQSEVSYLVVDHTKFDMSANILFDGIDRIDYLVTDQKLNPDWEKFAANKGIKIKYAEE